MPSTPLLLFLGSHSHLPLLISPASGSPILSGFHISSPFSPCMSYQLTLVFLLSPSGSKFPTNGHCPCGFTYIPASLRTWIFGAVSNSSTPLAIFQTMSASSCQLQPWNFKITLLQNYIFRLNPSQSLLNKPLASCQLQSYFLTNNLCNLAGFWLYKLCPFCSLQENSSSASWICVFWAAVLTNPK